MYSCLYLHAIYLPDIVSELLLLYQKWGKFKYTANVWGFFHYKVQSKNVIYNLLVAWEDYILCILTRFPHYDLVQKPTQI